MLHSIPLAKHQRRVKKLSLKKFPSSLHIAQVPSGPRVNWLSPFPSSSISFIQISWSVVPKLSFCPEFFYVLQRLNTSNQTPFWTPWTPTWLFPRVCMRDITLALHSRIKYSELYHSKGRGCTYLGWHSRSSKVKFGDRKQSTAPNHLPINHCPWRRCPGRAVKLACWEKMSGPKGICEFTIKTGGRKSTSLLVLNVDRKKKWAACDSSLESK